MALAAWAYTIMAALLRVRCIILERERHAEWARQFMENSR
jgi:heme exporter protein C